MRPCTTPYQWSSFSTISFDSPYGFTGACGCVSSIGTRRGFPYVAHVEEKTIEPTPAARIASSSVSVPTVLLWKYFDGFGHRLADERVGGEVHDGVDAVAREHIAQAIRVDQRAPFERPPLDGPLMALREVVEDDRLMTASGEELCGVAADVSGAARHENVHEDPFRPEQTSVRL